MKPEVLFSGLVSESLDPGESSSFKILFREDLSLKELLDLTEEGYSVVKTPHIGNFYPNNLAIAKTGIHMIVYDRNIGCVDRNFHPHTVIMNGRMHPVTSSERLMTHAYVCQDVEISTLKDGERAADGHLLALKKVFPKGRFTFYTDYVSQNKEISLLILKIVSEQKVLPEKFRWVRRVDSEGFVSTVSPPVRWEDVSRVGIFGLDNEKEGFLIPNFFNVLLCGIIEVMNSGKEEIYHLSGPDMVRYIGSMSHGLSECLSILASKKSYFPRRLLFNLVPAAGMRFATRSSKRKTLDDLISAYMAILDHRNRKGDFMKLLDPSVRKSYGHFFKDAEQKLRRDLYEAMTACPEVFYDIYQGDYISQHDVLHEGLYVPKWSLENKIGFINGVFNAMKGLQRR